ncbi:hypothetical protein MGG_16436 [Pyricularia oryzae 70-15]|uniref:Uncharacterized protein n=3 Tax=Pyricularia oryzae TaxID=318829 RepID=G4MNZ3_PYRO7|nr:uncharacterized protein MGG_16436 [Pyricularia oryzae 70-15]EHA57942.1 hypothetical protein MGG_16436 [Pyricularia oryzae 70-15]ELQ36928.1 hypothetical protein OOU_Y34scaffold00624g24 [Pyricularia oryzae Y34]KAI7924390.1 hypothetical protein M9X92_003835 [Pyricularia oryzae]KAI7931293.1 hypothetical protein M0657_001247 [Pyricularia oryzae]
MHCTPTLLLGYGGGCIRQVSARLAVAGKAVSGWVFQNKLASAPGLISGLSIVDYACCTSNRLIFQIDCPWPGKDDDGGHFELVEC